MSGQKSGRTHKRQEKAGLSAPIFFVKKSKEKGRQEGNFKGDRKKILKNT